MECAAKKQKSLFENVIIDWSFQPEDPSTDFSDDDIDDKVRCGDLEFLKNGFLHFRIGC